MVIIARLGTNGVRTLRRVFPAVETILADAPRTIEPRVQTRVAVLTCLRAALKCCAPTRANLMQFRTLWDILVPSHDVIRELVYDGLNEDGRGASSIGMQVLVMCGTVGNFGEIV